MAGAIKRLHYCVERSLLKNTLLPIKLSIKSFTSLALKKIVISSLICLRIIIVLLLRLQVDLLNLLLSLIGYLSLLLRL